MSISCRLPRESHGKRTMMHCCGSVYPLINRLIEIGLDILNPIQHSAKNMNPEKLAQEFGSRIAFHGGIDTQQFLPKATPEEVREKVGYTCGVLGKNGGYILAGSHHIQADVPLEKECPRDVLVANSASVRSCETPPSAAAAPQRFPPPASLPPRRIGAWRGGCGRAWNLRRIKWNDRRSTE